MRCRGAGNTGIFTRPGVPRQHALLSILRLGGPHPWVPLPCPVVSQCALSLGSVSPYPCSFFSGNPPSCRPFVPRKASNMARSWHVDSALFGWYPSRAAGISIYCSWEGNVSSAVAGTDCLEGMGCINCRKAVAGPCFWEDTWSSFKSMLMTGISRPYPRSCLPFPRIPMAN